MSAKVLIVEDEAPLAEMLRYNLEAEGFRVSHAETGEEALILLEEENPDLVVLDWMLPGVSGIELCRRLRAKSDSRNVPIIMLTARGEEQDRIRGLSTGADDYVVKPFSLPELMARVKAILRRSAPDRLAEVLKIGDIELDRAAHKVTRGLRQVRLGPDRVPAPRVPDGKLRPRAVARAAARRRVGARRLRRRAHRRCAHRPSAGRR